MRDKECCGQQRNPDEIETRGRGTVLKMLHDGADAHSGVGLFVEGPEESYGMHPPKRQPPCQPGPSLRRFSFRQKARFILREGVTNIHTVGKRTLPVRRRTLRLAERQRSGTFLKFSLLEVPRLKAMLPLTPRTAEDPNLQLLIDKARAQQVLGKTMDGVGNSKRHAHEKYERAIGRSLQRPMYCRHRRTY